MAKYASTTHLILLKQTSKKMEDLIDALHNYKAVCEYQGLDFTFDKLKKFEEIHKALTKNSKKKNLFSELKLYQKSQLRIFLVKKAKYNLQNIIKIT